MREASPVGAEGDLEAALRDDVAHLAGALGERHDQSAEAYAMLVRAERFIVAEFAAAGWPAELQRYVARGQSVGPVANVIAERVGEEQPGHIVVVGAHYDSVRGGAGANDNASGVAALLAIARALGPCRLGRTLRLVAFTNEAPPHTRKASMGSLGYASRCSGRGEMVVAMVSLETIGYRASGGPPDVLPRWRRVLGLPGRGADGLAFVGNLRSTVLARRAAVAFRRASPLPARWLALPSVLPGVRSSDHWSFWHEGYAAIMATGRGPLRYRHDHRANGLPGELNYAALASAVRGLIGVVGELAASTDYPESNAAWA